MSSDAGLAIEVITIAALTATTGLQIAMLLDIRGWAAVGMAACIPTAVLTFMLLG